MQAKSIEAHLISRIGWLRAAVLGANDGLLSTASLIVGVAAASGSATSILVAGIAGMVAGSASMAAGEYVSVSSQHDTEQAELAREKIELESMPKAELEELANIYVKRGVAKDVAHTVAKQLMAKDALSAHARDELGITEELTARPIQAALTSALTFAIGASAPLLVVLLSPRSMLVYAVAITTLLFLAVLGAIGSSIGGSSILKGALRVTFWGALALALTAAIGLFVGKVV
jgi:VIT1/CCC1 family predicted Fe2+/Mn2+ transporter